MKLNTNKSQTILFLMCDYYVYASKNKTKSAEDAGNKNKLMRSRKHTSAGDNDISIHPLTITHIILQTKDADPG